MRAPGPIRKMQRPVNRQPRQITPLDWRSRSGVPGSMDKGSRGQSPFGEKALEQLSTFKERREVPTTDESD